MAKHVSSLPVMYIWILYICALFDYPWIFDYRSLIISIIISTVIYIYIDLLFKLILNNSKINRAKNKIIWNLV